MKIWVLEIGEPLPLETGVRLHRYGMFTRYLAEQGHQVTWWASSFSHAPKKHFAEQDTTHQQDGLCLELIKGPGYSRNVSPQRIWHSRHFAQRFLQLAELREKPDLIICPIPTVETAMAGSQYAKNHGIPFLLDIRDLWPDEIKDLAPSPLRPLAKIALRSSYLKMKTICSDASGIMGVSESYLNYGLEFSHRARNELDAVFPLGYSPQEYSATELNQARAANRQKGILEDKFTLCFFGTLGRFFEIPTVLEAAHRLRNNHDFQFVIAGDGSHRNSYEKKAKALGLTNVIFPGWLNGPEIQEVMKTSQVGLAPYKVDAKMSLPNKPFEYMSGGLPVLSSIRGELRSLLQDHECGISYRADHSDDLTRKISDLYQKPELRRQMGANALELFHRKFSSQVIFKNAEEHFLKVTNI